MYIYLYVDTLSHMYVLYRHVLLVLSLSLHVRDRARLKEAFDKMDDSKCGEIRAEEFEKWWADGIEPARLLSQEPTKTVIRENSDSPSSEEDALLGSNYSDKAQGQNVNSLFHIDSKSDKDTASIIRKARRRIRSSSARVRPCGLEMVSSTLYPKALEVCMHVYMHACMYVLACIHIYMHSYMHSYMHTHTYTHTQYVTDWFSG